MDAIEAKRTDAAIADALRLQTVWPELLPWCTWVVAGCESLNGNVSNAFRLFENLSAGRFWLSDALLNDRSLEPVWALPEGPELRATLRCMGGQPQQSESLVTVQRVEAAKAVVIALHGNGPLPMAAQQALWRGFPELSVYALRSRSLLAPGIHAWNDRILGRQAVHRAAIDLSAQARGVPIVVVGLGSGGTIALEVAGQGPAEVQAVVAVAPNQPQTVYDETRACSAVAVLDSTEVARAASLEQWAGPLSGVRVHRLEGLGHAFPRAFGAFVCEHVMPQRAS